MSSQGSYENDENISLDVRKHSEELFLPVGMISEEVGILRVGTSSEIIPIGRRVPLSVFFYEVRYVHHSHGNLFLYMELHSRKLPFLRV